MLINSLFIVPEIMKLINRANTEERLTAKL
jgi:hypothetical protein